MGELTKTYYGKPFPKNWDDYDACQREDWKQAALANYRNMRSHAPMIESRAKNEVFNPRPLEWNRLDGMLTSTEVRELVLQASEHQAARGVPVSLPPNAYEDIEVNPNAPILIRALYGPLKGLDRSFVVTCPNTARNRRLRTRKGEKAGVVGIIDQVHDNYGADNTWGPRRFVWELMRLGARFDGQIAVLMVHSGLYFEFDPEEFRTWCERAQGPENLVDIILAPSRLLETDP